VRLPDTEALLLEEELGTAETVFWAEALLL
jgi:hypothetical protein